MITALYSVLCGLFLIFLLLIPVQKLRPTVQFEVVVLKRCCSPEKHGIYFNTHYILLPTLATVLQFHINPDVVVGIYMIHNS